MKNAIKKTAALLTAMALLAGLGACGDKSQSTSSLGAETTAAAESVQVQSVGDYIIPTEWKENSIDDGSYAYITEAAETDNAEYTADGLGHLYRQETDMDRQVITVSVCSEDGDDLYSVDIPLLQPVENWNEDGDYLETCVPLADCLWVIHSHSTYDQEKEQADIDSVLEQWSAQGTLLQSIPMADYGVNGQDTFVMDMAAGENDELLLLTSGAMHFLDKAGNIIASRELDADGWYHTSRDSSGRCYLADVAASTELYTVDWENHAQGALVVTIEENGQLMPGGGAYDFFLVSSDQLIGLSLRDGAMTEILRWADCDLTGSVGTVSYVDEDRFLVRVSSILSDGEDLYLRRVPSSEVPEKTTLYLAVPLQADENMPDRDWSESLDQMILEEMNAFNRRSPDYRLQVVTYGNSSDLQLLMQSDTPPDLICWDGDWLEDPPSAQVYAAKGYLVDLEGLVEADDTLSMTDFIPRCIELLKDTYGGLYLFPRELYGRTMVASKEYVGDAESWSLADFCRIAEALPEGVSAWNGTGDELLSILLETNLGEFVDYQAGTCNFESQTFMDLLNVCRDKCPAEPDTSDDYLVPRIEAVMGRLGQFAQDVVVPAREQGMTLIGYPVAKGNGMNLTFRGTVSMTTIGSHQEAAWSFLRELMTYDFQSHSYPIMSMRQDVFQEIEDRYQEMYPDAVSAEDYAAVREMPYEAGCTTVYDSPPEQIVLEEAAAFFAGDKSAEDTARVIQSRVSIYLAE